MTDRVFDCIIVGAGPSGGSAAYHLAKRGRSTLVLDKATLPRYKPCGGGVAPIVQEWFDFDFSPAISLKIDVTHHTWNNGDPVEVELQTREPIWMVRRDIFDHFLVQQAQRQGAELRDGTLVTGVELGGDGAIVKTKIGEFAGRYLIAADGGRGPLARWLGFAHRQRAIAGALEAEFAIPDQCERRAFFEFGMVRKGYLWNFPKADGYSIGIAAFGDRGSQNLRQTLARYAQSFGVDLATASQAPHPISVWNGNQTLHVKNALLAGEAACVVDPLTAEGIRPSMFSGIKAAEAVDRALAGDLDAIAGYSQTISTEWGTEMIWARRLADLFYRFPRLGYQMGVKRAGATRAIGRILSGEARYSELAQRGLDRLKTALLPGA
ncbi:geranylgeranyl reductase family protein [Rubidibacter lacunae KORDI 51-2]|uniref:Geranylgeranyl reductase family protein n=1 Tax=Rubidibacter lacunae KORDI 51-2 TaxID=582515 RepID=U5DFL8_9CHRO|nr:geranylgeranyl reductase family protein [Rubidibacter lacunae]ERN40072.1 geranylgeranyl reductase family protein [Rubidibacter lacunae KORDI 51-2]